jgi:hypothetical protein
MHTAEPFVPEPGSLRLKLLFRMRRYKLLYIDKIQGEVFQAEGNIFIFF